MLHPGVKVDDDDDDDKELKAHEALLHAELRTVAKYHHVAAIEIVVCNITCKIEEVESDNA